MPSIIIFLFVLSIIVISHELGHFIAARISGVTVERFALGFGPPLLKLKVKETLFLVCLIPLGGYVKLAGDERDTMKGTSDEFFSKPPGLRAKIVFFGPLFNFILALFIFWATSLAIGVPSSQPVVGEVIKYGSVTKGRFTQEQLGVLMAEGIIEEYGGDERYFRWLYPEIEPQALQSIGFDARESKRITEVFHKSLKVTHRNKFNKAQLAKLVDKGVVDEKIVFWRTVSEEGLRSKLAGAGVVDIAGIVGVLNESRLPAYRAGVKDGDAIVKINGQAVDTWGDLSSRIKETEGVITLTVIRNKTTREITVMPDRVTLKTVSGEKEISMIGILPRIVKGNALKSLMSSFQKLYELTDAIFEGFALIVTRKVSFKESVAGPIGIGMLTSKFAQLGVIPFFEFVGILSLSLGIINLFPFPVLDGGHLFFLGIEKLRQKPLSEKWEQWLANFGLGVLVSLMLFICYNDIVRSGIGKARLSYQQLQKLESENVVKEIENDGAYVFWTVPTKEKLIERLGAIGVPDIHSLVRIWEGSSTVTEVERR